MSFSGGSTSASPSAWGTAEVEAWARRSLLSDEVVVALVQNAVDGPTLVTLNRHELQDELGIRSLPARRYLWDLIERLRSEQVATDLAAAVSLHETEISDLESRNNGENSDEAAILDQLRSDAAIQRQILQDHILAHQVQREMAANGGGQQVYEDSETARQEQLRLQELAIQSDRDHQLALELSGRGEARGAANETASEAASDVSSVLGMYVETGTAYSTAYSARTGAKSGRKIPESDDEEEDDERKPPSLARVSDDEELPDEEEPQDPRLWSLPYINRCNVCFDVDLRGFELACTHPYCVQCMRSTLLTGVKDVSLLPLTCCEVPIDISCARFLLSKRDAQMLFTKTVEVTAKNKMYCPDCESFLNLDLVDVRLSKELTCSCGKKLCTFCKTGAHPGLSCAQNKDVIAGADEPVLEMAREEGWKQCPKCNSLIELVYGCNHITCASCSHEFCFRCLSDWDRRADGTYLCSSGRCVVWDEDRLLAAGEARVQAQEVAQGVRLEAPIRQERLRDAMAGLEYNGGCLHDWRHVTGRHHGDCERCGFHLWIYAYVCDGGCASTVCYTCAHHRIPQRGWR